MANPVIRTRMIELLTGGDFTVTALADRLAVSYNSAAKAITRAREEGEVHVCGYAARTAAIYRLGAGVDVARPALDPVVPAPSCRDDWSLIRERAVSESVLEYFELDVLPGVKHFTCNRYKATLSVESCADKFKLSISGDAFGRHAHCRLCPIGAAHSGAGPDLNLGTLKGGLTCSRCHRLNGRLIRKRMCISCQNREYEYIKQRNAKGTKPLRHPSLHRLTIGYMAGGKVRTHAVERAIDMTELIVDVLRDSEHSPSFAWLADPATRALRDTPDLDFSISGNVDEVAPVADVDVPTVLDVVQPDPAADVVEHVVDPFEAVRRLLDDVRDVPVRAPLISKRQKNKLRQQQRQQVRLSTVTIQLMRVVGALPPAPPVVTPAPEPHLYLASVMSGGAAFGDRSMSGCCTRSAGFADGLHGCNG
ncbi:hypothetical protein [Paraburkholderia nemoris]|uniref:hypothetical protein n=1 Tax=Paraburkholderia nemoris TaxID=2793076 RepID=UPI001B1565A5|nr:hypothetical protein [Paraburkholderia nemoris]CAE6724957.1 hypothetical protein LMG22931_01914 [Paraburkholderia nemoris]